MKTRKFYFLAVALATLTLTTPSCTDDYIEGIEGQGEIVESTVFPEDFDGIVSSIAATIYLTQGEKQEVVIQAQENIIENILLDVRNGIWTIEYDRWVRWAKPVKIFITMPDLTKAGITGSGAIIGETRFEGLTNLDLMISGSGNIDLDSDSEAIDLSISGAGRYNLAGKTEKLDILVSGSGSIDAFDLETIEAKVTISGSGNAYLDASDYLKVTITGSGSVFYEGNPDVESHISGSGNVRKYR
jgi:hypothetical protein